MRWNFSLISSYLDAQWSFFTKACFEKNTKIYYKAIRYLLSMFLRFQGTAELYFVLLLSVKVTLQLFEVCNTAEKAEKK